jgi:hypothetical protein
MVEGLAGAVRDYGAELTWQEVAGATHYRVLASDDHEQSWMVLAETEESAVMVDGLVAGREYSFVVRAVGGGGEGPPSESVRLTPTGPVPTAVADLEARGTRAGELVLSWRPAPHTTRYAVRLRNVTRGGRWRTVRTPAPIEEPSFTIAGLRSRDVYAVRVRSWNMDLPGGVTTAVRERIPRPAAVRRVRARTPAPLVVVVRGRPVAAAGSYRLFTAERHGCRHSPAKRRYTRERAGLDLPRVRFRTRSRAVWVMLRAVRNGVNGRVVAGSRTCVVPRR